MIKEEHLYYNHDGTIGKVYDMPCGGQIKVNDARFVPQIENIIAEQETEQEKFHDHLMSIGVKAYRVNDGWVNREKCVVRFFRHEKQHGWYWGNLNLNVGDKIFIGNYYDGGRIAEIKELLDYGLFNNSRAYKYKPLDKTIDGIERKFNTKNNLTTLEKIKVFFGYDLHLKADIFV